MVSVLAGLLLRAPCTTADWSSGVQYTRFCYSDILPAYDLRGIGHGRIPYLESSNEYPVGTGMFMAVAAWIGRSKAGYSRVSFLLLGVCAVVASWLLYHLRGSGALLFAGAPTLILYSFVNWDLLAVALAVGGTTAFLHRRDGLSGVLLGLGTAAKLYPALLVLPFAWQRSHEGDRRGAIRLMATATGAWTAVNLPFAFLSFERWSYFFRFNSARPTDWGSLLATGCHLVTGNPTCPSVGPVNLLSIGAFLAVSLVTLRRWRNAVDSPFPTRFEPWGFAPVLVIAFLLTNKVFSPQYSLWLLPWFALALPNLRLFVAFELADVAVFVTHFSWQARLDGLPGLPLGALEFASLLRATILVVMLLVYLRNGAGGGSSGGVGRPIGPRSLGRGGLRGGSAHRVCAHEDGAVIV
ncbi:MAG: glycosyltransferase 87 family protein [Candidatus Velamenicoccus archaeovorus]